MKHPARYFGAIMGLVLLTGCGSMFRSARGRVALSWSELPDLPNELGVAGPFAGMSNGAMIVAGGANFPEPVWEHDKVWYSQIHVLEKVRAKDGESQYRWADIDANLPTPLAYGASVSTPYGLLCMGGNDGVRVVADAFFLVWDPAARTVTRRPAPPLPTSCCYGAATMADGVVYLAGGCEGLSLSTAMANFWSLDLNAPATDWAWQVNAPWPGPTRAFNLTASQSNGDGDCIYVMTGRRSADGGTENVEFLSDAYEYDTGSGVWQARQNLPSCMMAGTAAALGARYIYVFGGADGSLFYKTNELKDSHPGFPPICYRFDTFMNEWQDAGKTPLNHVTTVAFPWSRDFAAPIVIPSGEIRPRVRSPKIRIVRPRLH